MIIFNIYYLGNKLGRCVTKDFQHWRRMCIEQRHSTCNGIVHFQIMN